MNTEYTFFENGLLRVPFYPYSFLRYLNCIDSVISLKAFKEAIYIASPSLYDDIYTKNNREEKVILSLAKYFVRSCTRCTPYGLFAGCSVNQINEKSHIQIAPETDYKIYSRIDMEYLCDIIRMIEQDIVLKDTLKYHTNSTLYYSYKNVRYIEYIINNHKRKYSFAEVELSEYLDIIIQSASQTPQTIESLAKKLISEDVSYAEAKDFINELINEQILVSELEPAVTGEDLVFQLQHKLNVLNKCTLNDIISLLRECDNKPIGEHIIYYEQIIHKLSKQYPFLGQNWLHVDCMIPTISSSIGREICDTVMKGISILEKLTPKEENDYIISFKEAFYKKYEEQEVQLYEALDPQTGIGFAQWNEMQGDVNPLVDDLLILPNSPEQLPVIKMNPLLKLLIQKYEICIKEGETSIAITDADLKSLKYDNIDYSSNLLHAMIKVIDLKEDNKPIIFMDSAIGTSAANLLSRFEYLDNNIEKFVNEITSKEDEFYSDKILAEIVHLPEDRIGNIQMHPRNRKYEIHYMSNPYNEDMGKTSIAIDDIMISVPYGKKIVLRSKKFGKEIIPRLTTAHNYINGLPIYYFLSCVQHQNERSIHFSWGNYFDSKFFLPRVTHDNIILSPARWLLVYDDIPNYKNKSFDEFYIDFSTWRKSKKIPNTVLVAEFDNKLLIDFTNKLLTKLFINNLKKKRQCIIEEFLFQDMEKPFVKRGHDYFTNELILCLRKKQIL